MQRNLKALDNNFLFNCSSMLYISVNYIIILHKLRGKFKSSKIIYILASGYTIVDEPSTKNQDDDRMVFPSMAPSLLLTIWISFSSLILRSNN